MNDLELIGAQADRIINMLDQFETSQQASQSPSRPIETSTQLLSSNGSTSVVDHLEPRGSSSPINTTTSTDVSFCPLDLSHVVLYGADVSVRSCLFSSDTSSQDDIESSFEPLDTISAANHNKRSPCRRAFTIRAKQDILKRYDEVGSIRKVSTEVGIPRRHIQLWLKQRTQIDDPRVDLDRNRLGGGGRRLRSPVLEADLLGE